VAVMASSARARAARLDWAKLSEQGVNVNVLTSDRLTDMGESATFYSALVEVEAEQVE